MSIFHKHLWPVEITISNQTFGYDNGGAPLTVDIDIGIYDTVLELCTNLEGKLGVSYTVAVDQLGTVTISRLNPWDWDAATTDDGLEDILGLDGTEVVDASDVLTAHLQHTHGYYPGLISYGYTTSSGVGIMPAYLWRPRWPMIRQLNGALSYHVVGPASPSESADLAYGRTKLAEYNDGDIGIRALHDQCIVQPWRWYPDRALGTVAVPGTQNTDYFLSTFRAEPSAKILDGRYLTWSMSLNKEPV